MSAPCPICEDAGMRLVDRADGTRVAQECVCRAQRRRDRLIEAAEIPERFRQCSFESYETAGPHPSLDYALGLCKNFVRGYPFETDAKGLLFVGPNGNGKTHLAVSLLRALISERSVNGLFVTYGDLLKRVQNSYNDSVRQTELDVLRPVLTAEVLVIDELGSSKPTEWVLDTVAHILNTRYNNRLTTIVTTNHANERQLIGEGPAELSKEQRDAWLAMYKETLGDRIGERMRSRLQEMCVVVEVIGSDLRQSVKRARFTQGEIQDSFLKEFEEMKRIVSSLPEILRAKPEVLATKTLAENDGEEPIVGPRRMGRHAKIADVSGRD